MKMAFEEAIELDCEEDNIIDQGRWNTLWERIVKYEGKYYKFTYDAPSTENSGDLDDMNEEEVDLIEVHQVEKLVKVWEPV